MYVAGSKRSVDSGETYFREVSGINKAGSKIAKKYLDRARLSNIPKAVEAPLNARIDHARWIVDCPNCNSAEYAFDNDLFWCSECNNSDVTRVRMVRIPQGPRRELIEQLLSIRKIKNRNWNSSESIQDLEEENKLDGVI